MTAIFDKAKNHFEQNLPFVIYQKPNETNVIGLFQDNNDLIFVNNFDEKGFVFCSFDGNKNIIIPENQSEILVSKNDFETEITQINAVSTDDENAQNQFETLVTKAIRAISNNQFQKVVLSRNELVEIADFDFVIVFQKLIQNYPTAFCSCFFHPKIGMWLGATPEQLLQVSDNKLSTVALAGTQKFQGSTNVIWEEKEKQEQQFVTDFITQNLRKLSSEIQVSEPFTAQAGNIVHIKTLISGNLNDDFNLKKIIEILHPTPAVCGLPKQETKDFITQNEGYNREFYSGFLGELNRNNKTDLFVNLRCMKIKENHAQIYVGCGITKDSVPKKEWEETKNKSMTIKNCLI
jgi:isochorismate synthase